jgi:hypothetical protein
MRALRGKDYLTLGLAKNPSVVWPEGDSRFVSLLTSKDLYAGRSSNASIIFAVPSCSQGSATPFA